MASLISVLGIGYTCGMKTAISLPDELFSKAERIAKRTGKSRSQVFQEALGDYVARHTPEEVTEAMNRACAEAGDRPDPFATAAAGRVLRRSDW